jgi:hypothetical protein
MNICGIEGMIPTGNHLSLKRKLIPSASSSTTNPTWFADSSKQQRREAKYKKCCKELAKN